MILFRKWFFLILMILFPIMVYSDDSKLTSGLINYKKTLHYKIIEGKFISKGSSRIEPIVNDLLKAFHKIYKNIDYSTEAGGSGVGIPALIDNKINLALLSRKIKLNEINKFMNIKGYPPTEIRIALDALRVIVNQHNPIDYLSLKELSAIFTSGRGCDSFYSIDNWEEIGWATDSVGFTQIETHIFNEMAGSRGFFKNKILCGSSYKEISNVEAKDMTDMVENIASSPYSIGFSSVGKASDYRVKTIGILSSRFHPVSYPSFLSIKNLQYPLSRYLYIYIDKPPKSRTPILYKEFFKFLFSDQGQKILLKHNAVPLPPHIMIKELTKILGK